MVVGEDGLVGRVVVELVVGAQEIDTEVAITQVAGMGDRVVLDHLQLPHHATRIAVLHQ